MVIYFVHSRSKIYLGPSGFKHLDISTPDGISNLRNVPHTSGLNSLVPIRTEVEKSRVHLD